MSESLRCPNCFGKNISTGKELDTLTYSDYACHVCDVIGDVKDLVKSDDINICPHCDSPEAVHFLPGGTEVCGTCGLFPTVEYLGSEIAFLWKKGSGIRKFLEKNRGSSGPKSQLGRFIRDHCGPKCPKSKGCSQSTTDLVRCRDFQAGESEEEEDVVYSGRGTATTFELLQAFHHSSQNKGYGSEYYKNKGDSHTRVSTRQPSTLRHAPNGWYANYMNAYKDIKQSGDTGS